MQDPADTHREQADEDVAAHGTLNVNETVVEEDDQVDNEPSEDVAAHGALNVNETVVEDDQEAD
jgi:hypothetical protein